jgi:glycosyltransferase involved in cell wall biosynthesis
VTPSYNQGEFIEETIRSVLLQGYPALEYFIVDGGSTDQTIDIIRKYEPWLAYWVSQPDGGQAAAINSALKRSSGIWFQNINSDDMLLAGALRLVGQSDTSADIVCGDVLEFSERNYNLVRNQRLSSRNLIRYQWRTPKSSWHQPGVFMKRESLLALGGYDENLQYLFDFHLTCRFLERFSRVHYCGGTLVRFRLHSRSKSCSWNSVFQSESILARKMLSYQLSNRNLRSIAQASATRLQFRQYVGCCGDLEAARRALAMIMQSPALAVDRMFLGSVRRHPTLWTQALTSSK